MKNSRKAPFMSEPVDPPLPKKIAPFSEESEGRIIVSTLRELNEEFGLNLDTDPDLSRKVEPVTGHGIGRTVVVGASHMRRTAQELIAGGTEVVDLSSPGWYPSRENLKTSGDYLARLKLTEKDCLILDLWSNSSLLGTDELGFPKMPLKSNEDGKYHILGKLQAAPPTMFEKILADAAPILEGAAEARILLLAPFPRYVNGKCCSDEQHLTNHGSNGFWTEMEKIGVYVSNVVEEANLKMELRVVQWSDIAGNTELYRSVPSTGELWLPTDPVHLSDAGYQMVADALKAIASDLIAEGEPASKRPRLDSIVPQPNSRLNRGGYQVNLPDWLTGAAARGSRGGGRGPSRGATRGQQTRGRGGYYRPTRGAGGGRFRRSGWRPRRF
jgi:hypothetical protein